MACMQEGFGSETGLAYSPRATQQQLLDNDTSSCRTSWQENEVWIDEPRLALRIGL